MTALQAVLLGLLQGIAEFFPISSSGHLAVAQRLFGISGAESEHMLYTVVLHLGTIAAIGVGLWPTIRTLDRAYLRTLAIAIAPLFPLVLALKPLKAAMASAAIVGPFFMVTGAWLLLGERFARSSVERQTPSWRSALTVGIAQAVALFPGISRMGATVSTGRFCGWTRTEALTFSLLLAIPTIVGATLVEVASALKSPEPMPAIPAGYYLIGFSIAFCVGLVALRAIRWIAEHGTFRAFGYYCLSIGALMTVLDRL